MSSLAIGTPLGSCRAVSVVHGRGPVQVMALREVDLEVGMGERVALLGPSGSGKTTLLHVLGGLIVPDGGEVIWRGTSLSSLDASARRRTRARGIAYVFQSPQLLPTFTAYENVAFAAQVNDEPAVGSTMPGPAELLELVGLAAKLDALPAELSGGEAQRASIARALAQRPSLLLCDEPTGHLDSDTGERVLDLIDALHAEFAFAQVTATHDPGVAERAHRIVTLSDGRVAHQERVT